MASPKDVSLVIEKINAARDQGDRISGMAMGKTVEAWRDIFNEAAQKLDLPVVTVEPLKGALLADISKHISSIESAFRNSAGNSVLILMDTTGNRYMRDTEINKAISDGIENLTYDFPRAVYVQIVPEINNEPPLWMYCMNPKKPHDPSKPFRPV